ncbi:hypothetical protein HK100_007373, partial [Physocladia obscura]
VVFESESIPAVIETNSSDLVEVQVASDVDQPTSQTVVPKQIPVENISKYIPSIIEPVSFVEAPVVSEEVVVSVDQPIGQSIVLVETVAEPVIPAVSKNIVEQVTASVLVQESIVSGESVASEEQISKDIVLDVDSSSGVVEAPSADVVSVEVVAVIEQPNLDTANTKNFFESTLIAANIAGDGLLDAKKYLIDEIPISTVVETDTKTKTTISNLSIDLLSPDSVPKDVGDAVSVHETTILSESGDVIKEIVTTEMHQVVTTKPVEIEVETEKEIVQTIQEEGELDIAWLANELVINAGMSTLELTDDGLTTDEIVLIAKALEVNTTLEKLNIEGNEISEEAFLALIRVIRVNRTLREVIIGSQKITISEELEQELASALEINEYITIFKYTFRNAATAVRVLTALSRNQAEYEVWLHRKKTKTIYITETTEITTVKTDRRLFKHHSAGGEGEGEFLEEHEQELVERADDQEITAVVSKSLPSEGDFAVEQSTLSVDLPAVSADIELSNSVESDVAQPSPIVSASLIEEKLPRNIAVEDVQQVSADDIIAPAVSSEDITIEIALVDEISIDQVAEILPKPVPETIVQESVVSEQDITTNAITFSEEYTKELPAIASSDEFLSDTPSQIQETIISEASHEFMSSVSGIQSEVAESNIEQDILVNKTIHISESSIEETVDAIPIIVTDIVVAVKSEAVITIEENAPIVDVTVAHQVAVKESAGLIVSVADVENIQVVENVTETTTIDSLPIVDANVKQQLPDIDVVENPTVLPLTNENSVTVNEAPFKEIFVPAADELVPVLRQVVLEETSAKETETQPSIFLENRTVIETATKIAENHDLEVISNEIIMVNSAVENPTIDTTVAENVGRNDSSDDAVKLEATVTLIPAVEDVKAASNLIVEDTPMSSAKALPDVFINSETKVNEPVPEILTSPIPAFDITEGDLVSITHAIDSALSIVEVPDEPQIIQPDISNNADGIEISVNVAEASPNEIVEVAVKNITQTIVSVDAIPQVILIEESLQVIGDFPALPANATEITTAVVDVTENIEYQAANESLARPIYAQTLPVETTHSTLTQENDAIPANIALFETAAPIAATITSPETQNVAVDQVTNNSVASGEVTAVKKTRRVVKVTRRVVNAENGEETEIVEEQEEFIDD